MKKIALFLCLLLCFGIVPHVSAAEEDSPYGETIITESQFTVNEDSIELLDNGGFETLASETTFDKWGLICTAKDSEGNSLGYIGSSYVNISSDANSGNRALKLTSETGQYVHALVGANLTGGAIYELSGWAKHSGKPGSAFLSMIITTNVDGKQEQLAKRINLTFDDIPANKWTQKIVRFTAPENAATASLMVRLMGEGEVLWDDISLLEEAEEITAPVIVEKKPAIRYSTIPNNSFEEYTPGVRPGWYCYGGSNGEPNGTAVTFSSEYAKDGSQSARVAVVDGAVNPWISTNVTGIVPGTTYQLSVWVLTPDVNRINFSISVEWYSSGTVNENAILGGSAKDHWWLTQNMEWREMLLEFEAPENAKSAIIRLRNFSTKGLFHVDNVTMYTVKEPAYAEIETDETFYYTEWPEGIATALANPYYGDALVGGKAEFAFVDVNGTESHKETVSFADGKAVYTFLTEWMTNEGKEYGISTKVYKPDGSLVQEHVSPIYRYPRPTYMGADGIFRKNGKEYNLILGNGVNTERLAMGPEKGGVTIVQLVGEPTVPMLEKMDKAHARGLLVLVSLYDGDKCAGSDDRIKTTEDMVKLVKDHPALWGYKVQDEPNQKNNTDEELMRAYTTIRNIDPHHPIYLDDSGFAGYKRLYRYADVIDIDYYGGSSADSGRIFTTMMDHAAEATKGRKPFTLLQQAFMYNNYLPTFNEFRHFAYQALFSGAAGFGFHSLGSDDGIQQIFMSRPVWDDFCEKWANWEMDFMFDAFVNHKYPQVNAFKDSNAMWRTFTDGTDIYAVVFNRNKTATHSVSIPLIDGEGNAVAGAFTATRVTGGSEKTASGDGTLSLQLGALAAEVWKISPTESASLSHLKTTAFRDLSAYPWANQAIACLEEEGIVNKVSDTWYGPGENITRGDFAMFLVRTLDLTAETSGNFDDVDADAEYADAVAVGKKLGILNGIGDNMFNPEGEITRQELMAITARGMRLKKGMEEGTNEDLDGFSDSSLVADWAVLDVASMVRLGIVRGNADGTVNPQGNTTRAEAAVIMNRVLSWAGQP